ncbi:hypothetical protein [Flammeovirga sp. SJP92]|nr:hypothetical protein [Flammeovirga sp. SJP92]
MKNKILSILKSLYKSKQKANQGCCTASLKRFEKDKKKSLAGSK